MNQREEAMLHAKHLQVCTALAGSLAVCTFATLALATDANATGIKYTSGIIDKDGSIVRGAGFTVVRNQTGEYTISFPAGSFPTHAPAMTCSPFGIFGSVPVCVVYGESYHVQSPTTFTIRIYNLSGARQDNEFQFTEITTK